MDRGNLVLSAASSALAFVAGIAVFSYLTVPNPQMAIDGNDFLAFDPEIGMVSRPSNHAKRIDGPTPNRGPLIYDIYTDDRGARVDGPAQQQSPAHVDIVTLGCSFTWGHPIQDQDTYAARLARDLGVSNSNFALAGFGTTQSLLELKRNRDLAPKLVIYGFITAHLDRNVLGCGPSYHPFCMDVAHVGWDEAGRPRIEPPLSDGVRRVRLHMAGPSWNPVTWLAHGIDVAFGRLTLAWYNGPAFYPARREEAFDFLFRDLRRTVAEMGAQLLVVYIPTNFEPPPPELTRTIGDARLLDMTPVFDRHKEAGGAPLYVVDDFHPNELAHSLIAREVERYIAREGLLAGPAK
jgi:hypothetical protein